MPVGTYCRENPGTVNRDASVREAAQRMDSQQVGCLVVADAHERPIGLVTDRDVVLRGLQRGQDPEKLRVAEIMSKISAKAREGTPVDRAVLRMGADHVRRLPVIDTGRLVGIISRSDVLKLQARMWDNSAIFGPPDSGYLTDAVKAKLGIVATR